MEFPIFVGVVAFAILMPNILFAITDQVAKLCSKETK